MFIIELWNPELWFPEPIIPTKDNFRINEILRFNKRHNTNIKIPIKRKVIKRVVQTVKQIRPNSIHFIVNKKLDHNGFSFLTKDRITVCNTKCIKFYDSDNDKINYLIKLMGANFCSRCLTFIEARTQEPYYYELSN